MRLGVCYYPEHWPRALWADDARRMAELGLSRVRIGEFAWSRLEPEPGVLTFQWLDEAIESLARAGLGVILCTPTATPPKWLVDAHPEILAVDAEGRPRRFGSRRHYCFSSEVYRQASARITRAVAERYGRHPAVTAWQTDNEYGCHDTTLSYSDAAAKGFRIWLRTKYGTVEALNAAWGTVFWSQDYPSFEAVDPPHLTVTEANPSHRLDFQRFSSDQVAAFNRVQTDILRAFSPGRDIVHNFMGFYTDFDHFKVAEDLDAAAWDSYPLGFTEQFWLSPEDKRRFARQGHPDISAFHHDLYRAVGRGRLWIMEQQPGPVNWARFNPAPLPGMVRLWSLEAVAHGAELVSYFRWRQAPFAQEQMHAGLNRPDNTLDHGGQEAAETAKTLKALLEDPGPDRLNLARSEAALVFDFEADWMSRIQPQGASFRWLRLAFETYGALRRLGVDVDFVRPGDSLEGYKLVVVPSALHASEALVSALQATTAILVFGPRSGSKTENFSIPETLPPGALRALLPLQVLRVESLRPDLEAAVVVDGVSYPAGDWREDVEADFAPEAVFADGGGAWWRFGRAHYLAVWPQEALFDQIARKVCAQAGVAVLALEEGVRVRRRGTVTFAFNYAPETRTAPAPKEAVFLFGGRTLNAGGVCAWTSS